MGGGGEGGPASARGGRRTEGLLAFLSLATIVVFSDIYLTQPLLPQLSHEFGVPPATAGLTVSVVVLMIALASLAYGSLGDTLGRRRVMVWSCLALAVPTLGCALAPDFGWLLVARAFQGLLIPGVTAIGVAYIGDHVAPARVGRAVGNLIGATVTGGLVGRLGSGFIAELFSWRAVFVAFGLLTLAVGVALALRLPPDATTTRTGWGGAVGGVRGHLADRRILGAYYIGGAVGSVLPGLAWQSGGWPGVVAACGAALLLALLADLTLCRAGPPTTA